MMLFATVKALRRRIAHDLIEARNELLTAEANLEHAKAHVKLLAERVKRLDAIHTEEQRLAHVDYASRRVTRLNGQLSPYPRPPSVSIAPAPASMNPIPQPDENPNISRAP